MAAETTEIPAKVEDSATSAPPMDIQQARMLFHQYVVEPTKAQFEPTLPPRESYTVNDYNIPVEGGEILVRCLVPVVGDEQETFPVLVYIHGGGMCVGNVELDDYPLRCWCVRNKLSVVIVDYRLAPEHPFPIPINDCHAALRWTASNTSLLKADLSKGFIVGGHSSGGNLSAALAYMARDDPFFEGRRLTGQFLREAGVCHHDVYPDKYKAMFRSIEENKDQLPVTKEKLEQVYKMYNAPPSDPRFSPLLISSHKDLPRAYIQAAGLDVLRDDSVVYAEVLREAGVEVKIDLYPDATHGFHFDSPTISRDVEEGLRWLLNRTS
ncbi:Alpha/Beta hydrolase protein [Cubamyces lactineus]|nr:Alpha/Beta hydrolase protein [Cubamyces lactineus]